MNLETLASWDLCTCTCDPTKHNRHFLEESLAKLSWVNTKGPGYGKRVFLRCRFNLKLSFSPRQAWDKHRENSKKERRVFCRKGKRAEGRKGIAAIVEFAGGPILLITTRDDNINIGNQMSAERGAYPLPPWLVHLTGAQARAIMRASRP